MDDPKEPEARHVSAIGITRRAGCSAMLMLPFSGASLAKASPGRREDGISTAPGTRDVSPTGIGAQADSIAYAPSAPGAQPRSVARKLDEFAVSVMDFMTPSQTLSVRQQSGTVDCTDAINAAFAHAQRSSRTVYMPDGVYLVGNLLFGSQSTTGQSGTPLGLQGQSKLGTILRARPGLTGTLLKSWSCAGVTFADFTIETIGTAAQAWDCAWKVGAGPSTENIIRHITISGGTAALHVDWNDLNDTYPTDVTVRVSDPTAASCGISAVQSGGFSMLRGCIWSHCYLRFGTQNGKLDGCWGHGVAFASGCLNHVEISSGQIYSNITHGSVLWSESTASFNSVRALICIATQFITVNSSAPAYFDLAAYSILKFTGCQWNGPTRLLLGKKSRNDSYANVLVKIEGGTHTGHLVLNDMPGFEIECEGFVNDSTGKMVTKNRSGAFTPVIQGDGSDRGRYIPGSATYGRYHRCGNIVAFKIRILWSAHTAAASHVHLQVTGLPLEHDPDGVDSVSLEYAGSTLAGANLRPTLSGGVINFYTSDGNPASLPTAGDMILSGTYSVKA